jgi:hypothetical protein
MFERIVPICPEKIDPNKAFPVLERLVQDGSQTFLDVRFDVAAGGDKREKRVHSVKSIHCVQAKSKRIRILRGNIDYPDRFK